MPLETDLSVSPYFEDSNPDNNYQKVLFKPAVAVQTRELNELQQILQRQIEIFGNNIFKRGTILDGCNFIYYDNYPYAKIKDILIDGSTADPTAYVGNFVKNANGLTAFIINSQDGFEASDPDLKTIYFNYINSGNSFNETAFQAGQVLTVYDSNNSIWGVEIDVSGSSYSNTDKIIFTPVLFANVTSGSLSVGDQITDPISGANGTIVTIDDVTNRVPVAKLSGTVAVTLNSVDLTGTGTSFLSHFSNGDYIALYSNTTSYDLHKINVISTDTVMNLVSNATFSNTAASYANVTSSEVLIQYRPITSDLSSSTSNANNWTFFVGNTIQGTTSSDLATILGIVGQNADGEVLTDSTGQIIETVITNRGVNYYRLPFASVKSTTGVGADLTAQNYIAKPTVAAVTNAVGSGYAFGVTAGHIYHKGHFIKVQPQTVIVDKYSRFPNNVAVAFETKEEIINSNQDTNLNDNALGEPNFNAPGADRLKLTANLISFELEGSTIDGEIFTITEFANGVPYKQNQKTEFNSITDEMALRTNETDGSYVVDRFLTTTSSPANNSLEGNTINIVVDPGTAYVEGYRLQTLGNFIQSVDKGLGTKTFENSKLSLNYENYIRVNEVGGFFEFDQANEIALYDTAKNFLTADNSIVNSNTNPSGTQIGTAKLRSFVHESGTPGTEDAVYRAYVFDIKMNTGKNFRDVRSIWYDGTSHDGVADAVLELDSTTNTNIAKLYGDNNKLVFETNYASIKNANNITYTYRTTNDTLSISNTGVLSISLIPISKTFPYTGTLTDAQKEEIYLAPAANLISFDSLGNVDVDGSTTVTGSGTTFINSLRVGDYIQVSNGVVNEIRRVESIANNTSLEVEANVGFSDTGVGCFKAWPAFVPINLARDTDYVVSVDSASEVMTIDLLSNQSNGFATATNTDVIVAYNVESANAQATSKTVHRDVYVKLRLSDVVGGTAGPWCLGIPDVFRLKGVWRGSSTAVSESDTEITESFYIDHNQTQNYYDLGYLYQKNPSGVKLTLDDWLLIKLDCFTASPGFYTVTSYVSANSTIRTAEDSKPLANLTTTVNTLEIPELFDDSGNYYDLINVFDFRPYVANTANVATTLAGATINPANTFTFSASDRYFPVPDSVLTYDVETFLPRTDRVVVAKNGKISVLTGSYDTGTPSVKPTGTMLINDVFIPEYPTLPYNMSDQIKDIINTRVSNENLSVSRITRKIVDTLFQQSDFNANQPLNYTQADIGSIDRRLRDVEYYVSLNFMQNQVKDRVIPSSISPSINRFKYGFFVDEYENDFFTEWRSPEFNATIQDNHAEPAFAAVNIVHANTDVAAADYDSVPIIDQPMATVPDANTDPVANCDCSTQTSNTSIIDPDLYFLYATQYNTKRYSTKSLYTEPTQTVTMGTVSSNVTLWCHFYSGKDQVYIYQGNTLIATGDDAVNLTNEDIQNLRKDPFFTGDSALTNKSYVGGGYVQKADDFNSYLSQQLGGSQRYTDYKTVLVNNYGSPAVGGSYLRYSGKITWTHNPSLGREYRIVVKKASVIWRYRLDFYNKTNDGQTCTCPVPPTTSPVKYNGTMKIEPNFTYCISKTQIVYTNSSSGGGGGGGRNDPYGGGNSVGVTGGFGQPSNARGGLSGGSSGGSSGGGGTYLCTALYNMGYIDKDLWYNDMKYGLKTQKRDPELYYGYAAWAKPVADYIQKDTTMAKIVRAPIIPFIRHWAKYMANQMYPENYEKDNLGRVFHWIGVGISKPIGKALSIINAFKKKETT